MIYAKGCQPKRFKCRICDYQAELKGLDSVIVQFNKDEYIIVKGKGGYCVFTEGTVRISPDDQNAKNWLLRKLREERE